jgi:hypothetical protein
MGRPQLYNEKTVVLSEKVPISQKARLKKMLKDELRKFEKPINNLKKIKKGR